MQCASKNQQGVHQVEYTRWYYIDKKVRHAWLFWRQ